MCCICWIAEDKDLICVGILEELPSIMGVMSINEEEPLTSIGFLQGVLIEIFQPGQVNSPPLLQMADARTHVSILLIYMIWSPHDVFAGLSCFHLIWKPFLLNMTAGRVDVLSAHTVTIIVMFSQSPSCCWYCGPAFLPPITHSLWPSTVLHPISLVPYVNSSSTSFFTNSLLQ